MCTSGDETCAVSRQLELVIPWHMCTLALLLYRNSQGLRIRDQSKVMVSSY